MSEQKFSGKFETNWTRQFWTCRETEALFKRLFFYTFFFFFWHVRTQKHMGWKIPGLPKSWVFFPQFSGSSWGPESKINERDSPFWLVVFLPSLTELWCVPRDSLACNYTSPLNSRNQGLGNDLGQTEPSPWLFNVSLFYGYWMLGFEWFIDRWFFSLNFDSIVLKYFFSFTNAIFFLPVK